jgi:hypothetical protein
VRVDDTFKRCLKAVVTTVGGHEVRVKQLLEVDWNRPYPQGMTHSLDAPYESLINAAEEIGDPVERYQAAKNLEARIDTDLKRIKANAAQELHVDRSWNQVGELLGVTGSRAEQISRAAR